MYSRTIKLSNEIITKGLHDDRSFDDTLESWNKAMYSQAYMDRIYWTYALLIMSAAPIVLIVIGASLVQSELLRVGNLVTIVLAATNLYGPLANMFAGFALLSQAVSPAKRIEESFGKFSAEKVQSLS